MLTHIVIYDGARQTKQRFLPQNMRWLGEVEMGVFDDQKVFSHCVCDQCGETFEKKSRVTYHIRGVHSRKFKYEVIGYVKSFAANCGKCSKRKTSVHFHMKKHAGIEDYIVMNAMQSMLVLQLWLVTSKQSIQILRAMIFTSATIVDKVSLKKNWRTQERNLIQGVIE